MIFASGPLPSEAIDLLRSAADVVESRDGVAAIADEAPRVTALVTQITDRVDGALLGRLPALRLVANVAVGVDNIDVAACAAATVIVTNTPDVVSEATADMAFGLLLAAARRIGEGDRMVRGGTWQRWSPDLLVGARVHGMKLGLLGCGRIGKAVARRARGFGMHVGYTQRRREAEPLERALGITWVPTVEALFETSDAVSIHVPLTAETRGMVSASLLARMRPGALLVNTARGPIVDEAALADALERGPLAAAGLDVFEAEPKVHPELLARPNAVFTPHIGTAEAPTRLAMAMTAARNVARVLSGEAALTPVR